MDTIPYLNEREENYFIGNGISGGGGDSAGNWNFLIGPDYTSPNFLKQESLRIHLDNQVHTPVWGMHRVRGTGMYQGTVTLGELSVALTDFAIPESPYLVRHIAVTNASPDRPAMVGVEAIVTNMPSVHMNLFRGGKALLLHADIAAPLFGNGDGGNWKDRYALLCWYDGGSALLQDGVGTTATPVCEIPPLQQRSFALYHALFDTTQEAEQVWSELRRDRAIDNDLTATAQWWHGWIAEANSLCLPQQQAVRERALSAREKNLVDDVVESMLIGIKMQQNRCGGFIAGVRKYTFSYVRDSHGACRGLLAAGHFAEVKQYLEVTRHKFEVFGCIPNSVQMGADTYTHADGNQYAECPAYILLLARDYFRQTHDLDFLKSLHQLLAHAASVQLDAAEEHGGLLPFNGDETEQYCVKKDGEKYGGFPALPQFNRQDWSMPSVAAAIASLDFYVSFLTLLNLHEEAATIVKRTTVLVDAFKRTFFRDGKPMPEWAQKRDGTFYDYEVTNFMLLPIWLGAKLPGEVEQHLVSQALRHLDKDTGFLPIAPGVVEGFCGHSLGYLLFAFAKLSYPEAANVFSTILHRGVVQRYGMVNEFYGPQGVPNPHNLRCFESGIVVEALIGWVYNLWAGAPAATSKALDCAR